MKKKGPGPGEYAAQEAEKYKLTTNPQTVFKKCKRETCKIISMAGIIETLIVMNKLEMLKWKMVEKRTEGEE